VARLDEKIRGFESWLHIAVIFHFCTNKIIFRDILLKVQDRNEELFNYFYEVFLSSYPSKKICLLRSVITKACLILIYVYNIYITCWFRFLYIGLIFFATLLFSHNRSTCGTDRCQNFCTTKILFKNVVFIGNDKIMTANVF